MDTLHQDLTALRETDCCSLLSEYQVCQVKTFLHKRQCHMRVWSRLRVSRCVHVTGVHFVLVASGRSAGMCLITEQGGIRALMTETCNHMVTVKM